MTEISSLVDSDNQILRQPTPRFDFQNAPIDPIELAHKLAKAMIANNGIGLSGPQIGLPYRAFCVASTPIICCFNPIIVDFTFEMIYLDETCCSFPGLFLKVKRPRAIKIRYTQPNGEVKTEKFIGITARAILHEIDHLDGIVFTQRANKYHLDQAKKRLANAKKVHLNKNTTK